MAAVARQRGRGSLRRAVDHTGGTDGGTTSRAPPTRLVAIIRRVLPRPELPCPGISPSRAAKSEPSLRVVCAVGKLLRTLPTFLFQCTGPSLSGDGRTALVSHDDSDMQPIDIESGTLLRQLGMPSSKPYAFEVVVD